MSRILNFTYEDRPTQVIDINAIFSIFEKFVEILLLRLFHKTHQIAWAIFHILFTYIENGVSLLV